MKKTRKKEVKHTQKEEHKKYLWLNNRSRLQVTRLLISINDYIEKCYVYSIFTINFKWSVVIGCNVWLKK